MAKPQHPKRSCQAAVIENETGTFYFIFCMARTTRSRSVEMTRVEHGTAGDRRSRRYIRHTEMHPRDGLHEPESRLWALIAGDIDRLSSRSDRTRAVCCGTGFVRATRVVLRGDLRVDTSLTHITLSFRGAVASRVETL
jgi:hypothetical protein